MMPSTGASNGAKQTSLTFFIELETRAFVELFADPTVERALAEIGAGLAVCMLDLSEERARLLSRLADAGIALTAWLVLEDSQGYWLTADNADAARGRFREFHGWARRNALTFHAVGLDVEPPRDDAVALMRDGSRALGRLLRHRRSRRHVQQAVECYAQLVDEIRRAGYVVESYQIPLLVDERAVRSSLLQRALGFVDLLPDREVLMLYRSVLPEFVGAQLIDAFGADADAIAVGVTGGGVEFVREAIASRLLDLETLLDELARASRYTDQLYIFSLEGCVGQGYFAELCRRLPSALGAPPSASRRPRFGQLAQIARAGLRLALRAEAAIDWLA